MTPVRAFAGSSRRDRRHQVRLTAVVPVTDGADIDRIRRAASLPERALLGGDALAMIDRIDRDLGT